MVADDALPPFNGISYYRLKQTDFNGAEKLSQIIAAKITNEECIDLFISGNPVQQSTTIYWHLPGVSNIQIILNDFSGKRFQIIKNDKETKGMHFLTLDKNSLKLSQGIYFLTLSTPSQIITRKLVIE